MAVIRGLKETVELLLPFQNQMQLLVSTTRNDHEIIEEDSTRSRGSLAQGYRKSIVSNSKTAGGHHPSNKSTVIHLAAERGNVDILALLLNKKYSLDDKRGDGITPIYLAAKEGYLEVVKLLHRHGAVGNSPVKKNNCLIIAHTNKNLDILDFLKQIYPRDPTFEEHLKTCVKTKKK